MAVTTYCDATDLATWLTWEESFSATTLPTLVTANMIIEMAAGEINATLQASDQLSCTKDDNMLALLEQLNVVRAALLLEFDNIRTLSPEELNRQDAHFNEIMGMIRTGELAVCQNQTGRDYPAFSVAEVGYTDHAKAQIYLNRLARGS